MNISYPVIDAFLSLKSSAMIFFLTFLSRLPLSFLYLISDVMARVASSFYRRKVVEDNLRECFPSLSEHDIRILARKFYFRLADFIVETLKGLTMNEQELKKRVQFLNSEIVWDGNKKKGPVLIFAAHQINWEWMALASSFYLPYPSQIIYQPLTDRSSEKLMTKLRSRFGNAPLKRDLSIRHILEDKVSSRAIGIVADQVPRQNMDKLWVRFLNRETPFFKGIVQLPYLTQAKAIFAHIRLKRRGHYEVEFSQIGHPPYGKDDLRVLKNYISESEKMIRSTPENWLWSHKRWKYSRGENEEMIKL